MNRNVLTMNKTGLSTGKPVTYKRMHPLYSLVILVVLLAGWGASLAYLALGQQTDQQIPGINQPATTSYGTIIVSEADDLIGLTSQDLAGVTHGIQNLVLVDKTQIQITVAMINRSGRTIDYSPEQFSLVASDNANDIIQISGSTIHNGKLQPRSNIEATLSFVVPRDGASYILQYLDPGDDQIVQIDLGGVDVVTDEELSKLHH